MGVQKIENSRFNDEELELLVEVCKKVTGHYLEARFFSTIVEQVSARIVAAGCSNFTDYMHLLDEDEDELDRFISSLAIHTTSFFREVSHYEFIYDWLCENKEKFLTRTFEVLNTACSTGVETYSFGMILQRFKEENPGFTYRIKGTDLDPVSIEKAKSARYARGREGIPELYKRWMEIDKKDFVIKKEVRENCHFSTANLTALKESKFHYDLVVCRNVLIYFSQNDIKKIVGQLALFVKEGGFLCLGHSDHCDTPRGMKSLGRSLYTRTPEEDLEDHDEDKEDYSQGKVEDIPFLKSFDEKASFDLVVIGSSTGGTKALSTVLNQLPETCPPIVIVQHIPINFTEGLFSRLVKLSGLKPGSVKNRSALQPGHIYLALNDCHVALKKGSRGISLMEDNSPPQHSQRPAVDVLFESAASLHKKGKTLGLLLTGMGRDGARGMKALKQQGNINVAQDKESSIVFGMPKKAIQMGGVHYQGSPREMNQLLCKLFGGS